MIKSTFPIFLGVALLTASSFSFAIPLDGGISFSNKTDTEFSYDEEQVVFGASSPNAEVDQVSGDFLEYFAIGDGATFSSFSYDPLSSGEPLWAADSSKKPGVSLQFNLAELTTSSSGARTLALEGTGILSDGNAQQSAFWSFTANEGQETFSWSSSADASRVPEPATLGLMSLGMLLLGLRFRRTA